jgi:uncharacterized protein (TIGR04255 family)
MPLPDFPHTVYQKNLLEQVICQLRFPPILKIDVQAPFEFQDIIRQAYPLFSTANESQLDLPFGSAALLPPGAMAMPAADKMNYHFFSEDEAWTVNLGSNFIALSSNTYPYWQPFRQHLELPLHTLLDIYHPAFFMRAGLRYVNVIRRSALGLGSQPWSELIQPQIAGILASKDIAVEAVQKNLTTNEIRLGAGQTLARLVHGLASDRTTGEQIYLMDLDLFSETRIEITDVLNRLDEFNQQAWKLFNWCISDRLRQAMNFQSDPDSVI